MGETQSKKENSVNIIDVIHKNKKTIEILKKKINHQENNIIKEINNAKIKLKSGDKKGALLCLKKKKMLEKQVDNFTLQMLNLEQNVITLEGSNMNKKVFDTMKENNNTMKYLNKNIDVDKISNLKDDINDQINELDEVSNLLAEPLNNDFDDDELLEELNSPEDDYTENIKIELPKIPNEKINILKDEEKENNEDKALEMLEKMMI